MLSCLTDVPQRYGDCYLAMPKNYVRQPNKHSHSFWLLEGIWYLLTLSASNIFLCFYLFCKNFIQYIFFIFFSLPQLLPYPHCSTHPASCCFSPKQTNKQTDTMESNSCWPNPPPFSHIFCNCRSCYITRK